jgi:hypothetical protein
VLGRPPTQPQAAVSPIARLCRLYQCPTTAAELILRHARSPRTEAVALSTRNDTCEAQRAAMEYARSELTRKGRSGDRDWTRGNILCHARLEARFNHVSIVFTGMTAAHSLPQLPSLEGYACIAASSQAQPSGPSQAQRTLDRDAPLRASNKRSHQVTLRSYDSPPSTLYYRM